jgi:hypothetical protein
MRKSAGDGCGQCDVYIIADAKSGIPQMLEDGSIFPGARVVDWIGGKTKLTGKVAEAIKIIEKESLTSRFRISGKCSSRFRSRVLRV